jgi:LysR family glycine cleavage system transcriptional activator
MGKLPLGLLQQFVLVARQGNLSRAAEQANLTVSALSHQMRQLEQRMERKLFDRGPRGVQLTAEGRRLMESVAHHFDGIELAMATYQCRREEALTISTLSGVMSSWLMPRVASLVARHPELELNLQSSSALVDFERDPADVAIRYGKGHWPGLRSEHLFDEWIVPVASSALLEHLPGADPDDMSSWPLLGDPGERWRDWFEQIGGHAPKRFVAQFDTTDALQRAALEGLGVALGRMVMARPLIDAGLLHMLGRRYLPIPEAYYLVYPERSLGHAGFRVFREWIRGQALRYGESMAYMSKHASAGTPMPAPENDK